MFVRLFVCLFVCRTIITKVNNNNVKWGGCHLVVKALFVKCNYGVVGAFLIRKGCSETEQPCVPPVSRRLLVMRLPQMANTTTTLYLKK